MPDRSLYQVGVVLELEETAKKGGKPLKVCQVDVGTKILTIVTNAPNVRTGSRVVVAPVGSVVEQDDGSELEIQPTSIAGTISQGMLCDSKMLGWSGGAAGIAVQVPETLELGSPPPATKPRLDAPQQEEAPSGPVTGGLFERKLTKEEKKKLAAEKRA
eukprot:CAMPEP_0176009248 /NCGR_PEP_ID=MMETSP0120_2-20121206/4155_1 /TAXON_ID=160619 /ORGANISM="Kryptoperidinium foliaceum, Strain CCMP 1326" /LENGTH=158 /DNA_ID=CAMNT_0017342043 /DNA_START=128 /DNA_END=601 /DNA_ORIENTATION=-